MERQTSEALFLNSNYTDRGLRSDKMTTPYRWTFIATVLLVCLLGVFPVLAQDGSPANQHSDTPNLGTDWRGRPWFEKSGGARDAIRRLSPSSRYWFEEDAAYIINLQQRCAFLLLETDEERYQFIKSFWNGLNSEPDSLNYNFELEHYRRIVFANEKFGDQRPGWQTDRGKVYVMLGPPDSINLSTRHGSPANSQTSQPAEKWYYQHVKGIGENVEFAFTYSDQNKTYVLSEARLKLLLRADPNPDWFPITVENIKLFGLYGSPAPATRVRNPDLEAIAISGTNREQLKFEHEIKFAAATHATTLAMIDIQIPCAACAHQAPSSVAYPLFIRLTKPSSWVVYTSELTADMAAGHNLDLTPTLTAHTDIPAEPGHYLLAIVAKDETTGEMGVVRKEIDVPTYDSLLTQH